MYNPSTTPHKRTVLDNRRAKTLAFDTGGGVAGRAAGAGPVSDMGEQATHRPVPVESDFAPARRPGASGLCDGRYASLLPLLLGGGEGWGEEAP